MESIVETAQVANHKIIIVIAIIQIIDKDIITPRVIIIIIIIIMKMRMTYLPTGLLTILLKSDCLGYRDPRSITR